MTGDAKTSTAAPTCNHLSEVRDIRYAFPETERLILAAPEMEQWWLVPLTMIGQMPALKDDSRVRITLEVLP